MPSYRADPTDRTKAVLAVVAVHAALWLALLSGLDVSTLARHAERLTALPITLGLTPPPPPTEPDRAAGEAGAPGKKADPAPVVAPKPMVDLPAPSPVITAPVASPTGTAPSAGASTAGSGGGAGGSGGGLGGGGSGGSGGIGSEARLLGGHRARLPGRMLRLFAADRGSAELLLTVAQSGRVTDCAVLQGSGSIQVDQALCGVMVGTSRWTPARDRQGRPISVRLGYTAIWSKR